MSENRIKKPGAAPEGEFKEGLRHIIPIAGKDDDAATNIEEERADEAVPEKTIEDSSSSQEAAEEGAKEEGEAEEPEVLEKEDAPLEASDAIEEGEEGKMSSFKAKIDELNEKHLRLMAEFENFRKRTEKEKESMFEAGARNVIEKILPVVDNFERALGMTGIIEGEQKESEGKAAKNQRPEKKEADPFMEGMRMVYKQLMTELSSIGVKPIEALGKEFNPDFHNAVMQEESKEEAGTILKELQKGYLYKDTVVRHSMVSVAG